MLICIVTWSVSSAPPMRASRATNFSPLDPTTHRWPVIGVGLYVWYHRTPANHLYIDNYPSNYRDPTEHPTINLILHTSIDCLHAIINHIIAHQLSIYIDNYPSIQRYKPSWTSNNETHLQLYTSTYNPWMSPCIYQPNTACSYCSKRILIMKIYHAASKLAIRQLQ